jgi:tetratricopeptide (TPR) repeat protein
MLAILGLLLRSPAASASEQWTQITSNHFSLITDANEKEGRHTLDQLERMRWVFGKFFPNLNADNAIPINVLAVKNGKTFDGLLPPDKLGKNQLQLAGLFMRSSDKNYILLRLGTNEEHPYATVYHEYTHQQIAAGHLQLPLWLNEGMAEFMQNTEFRDKDVVVGEASRKDVLYLRQNSLIPLPVLFKVDSSSPYYHEEQKGSVFYAESWALTHYLMINDHANHNATISRYAHLVDNGADPVAAAQQCFGDLKLLENALRAYIDHGQYMALALSSAAAPIDESNFRARTLSPADAEAAQADLMANNQRTDEARALDVTVLKEDANNVQAHETMGFIASRDGHFDEARKWYGEAIKLGSQNFLAYYNAASFSMGTDNEEAETDLRAAIRFNPGFAPSYDRLAALLAIRRDHLNEAHLLNLQAIQLEPGNIPYRINAAHVLTMMNRYNDAINVLKTAAQVARNERDAALIQSTVQQVQQIQQSHAEVFAVAQEQQDPVQVSESQSVVDVVPRFPTLSSKGPRMQVNGVIEKVTCSYPSEIELKVAGQNSNSVALYNNDYTRIELTAAASVNVPQNMNPCHDFEGKTVRVLYIRSQSHAVDGQLVAVELMK